MVRRIIPPDPSKATLRRPHDNGRSVEGCRPKPRSLGRPKGIVAGVYRSPNVIRQASNVCLEPRLSCPRRLGGVLIPPNPLLAACPDLDLPSPSLLGLVLP